MHSSASTGYNVYQNTSSSRLRFLGIKFLMVVRQAILGPFTHVADIPGHHSTQLTKIIKPLTAQPSTVGRLLHLDHSLGTVCQCLHRSLHHQRSHTPRPTWNLFLGHFLISLHFIFKRLPFFTFFFTKNDAVQYRSKCKVASLNSRHSLYRVINAVFALCSL